MARKNRRKKTNNRTSFPQSKTKTILPQVTQKEKDISELNKLADEHDIKQDDKIAHTVHLHPNPQTLKVTSGCSPACVDSIKYAYPRGF